MFLFKRNQSNKSCNNWNLLLYFQWKYPVNSGTMMARPEKDILGFGKSAKCDSLINSDGSKTILSNKFIYWGTNSNTLFLALKDWTSNFEHSSTHHYSALVSLTSWHLRILDNFFSVLLQRQDYTWNTAQSTDLGSLTYTISDGKQWKLSYSGNYLFFIDSKMKGQKLKLM